MDDNEVIELLDRWRLWSRLNNSELGFKTSQMVQLSKCSDGLPQRNLDRNDQDCERLDAAISSMPKKMSKLIKLKYLYGWINRDTAKALDMNINTFKILAVQCRAWLAGRLSQQNTKQNKKL